MVAISSALRCISPEIQSEKHFALRIFLSSVIKCVSWPLSRTILVKCIFFHQLKKTLEHRKGKGARLHDRIGIEDPALVKLYSGVETLESGLGDLSDGMDTLYDGLGDLYDGAAELVSGLGELKDGSEEMKDGTTEFQDKTSDIDDQIEDKIDELIDGLSGKDYEPVSFTSSKNTDIGLVQFAIHTEAIKKADTTEEETEAETETESETILSRVKSLFS